MKNPSEMSDTQLMKWLTKTSVSIGSFKYSGGTMTSDRGYDLLDRYGDLVDEMKQNRYQLWKGYCLSIGSTPSHNQYDLWA